MSLLDKLLHKRGITSTDELAPEEKVTFENWKSVLSKKELTVSDIKDFCVNQLSMIESRWNDFAITSERKAELIPYFSIYKNLLTAIDSPKSVREALEKHLNQLIQN